MYYKSVPMSLEEAVEFETQKGFETRDEFQEVMMEIAFSYKVTLAKVYGVFYNQGKE